MIWSALAVCAVLSGIVVLFSELCKWTRGMWFVRNHKGYRTWGNSHLACFWIWVIFLVVCHGAFHLILWVIYHD